MSKPSCGENKRSRSRSKQSGARTSRGLFAANVSVSRQTVEAAERQVAADIAKWMSICANVGRCRAIALPSAKRWRAGDRTCHCGTHGADRAARPVDGGRCSVCPSDFLHGVADTPSTLKLERVAAGQGGAGWTTNRIWNAPADPTVPGRSFYVLISGARGLLARRAAHRLHSDGQGAAGRHHSLCRRPDRRRSRLVLPARDGDAGDSRWRRFMYSTARCSICRSRRRTAISSRTATPNSSWWSKARGFFCAQETGTEEEEE